jgi:hypothetical protein
LSVISTSQLLKIDAPDERFTGLPKPVKRMLNPNSWDRFGMAADFRFWHKADISLLNPNVRFWGESVAKLFCALARRTIF